MKFFILECISFNNICRHANISHHLIVSTQWSDQSDNDTRIWYYGWVQTKKSLQAPPPFFASPGYTQLALLADFLVHSAIHGSLFTGYVIWRLDREKGILALVVTIISCPPPPPQIISARYITVEPQSSKQSRFLIIENYMNIDVVFLVATSIISKDDYPQQ